MVGGYCALVFGLCGLGWVVRLVWLVCGVFGFAGFEFVVWLLL